MREERFEDEAVLFWSLYWFSLSQSLLGAPPPGASKTAIDERRASIRLITIDGRRVDDRPKRHLQRTSQGDR